MRSIVILSLLLIIVVTSCKDKFEKTKVVQRSITESVYASGVVEALNQYIILPTVSGTISNLYIEAGDQVKKGQSILQIKNTTVEMLDRNAELDAAYNSFNEQRNRINEMESNIQSLQIQVDQNKRNYERADNLYKKDAGTESEMEIRKSTYQNSLQQLTTLKYQLAELKKQLKLADQKTKNISTLNRSQKNDYTISSQMDGRLYELFKENGELVSPQTPIGVIGDNDEFIIKLQVDQRDIVKTALGQKVFLTIESDKDNIYEAVVTKIIPFMNERSKTFTVEATFTKSPPTLFPNLTLEGNIIINQKDNALLIPRKYLLQGDSVLMNNDKKVKVKVGLRDFQYIEILEGVKLGDELKVAI